MENKVSNFSQILLESPKNCWLALAEDESKVVAIGLTPDEAEAKAKKEGVEDPLLIWSPEDWGTPSFLSTNDQAVPQAPCESSVPGIQRRGGRVVSDVICPLEQETCKGEPTFQCHA